MGVSSQQKDAMRSLLRVGCTAIEECPEEEYEGAVLALVGDELLAFSDMAALQVAEAAAGWSFGNRVFAAEERGLVLDAVEILEECNPNNGLVRDLPTDEDAAHLQLLLDGWCDTTKTRIFECDYSRVVIRRQPQGQNDNFDPTKT